MNFKTVSLYFLAVVAALAIGGCAQDSTNTSDDNPEMQEQVMKGTAAEGAAKAGGATSDTSSTDTTRTEAKGGTGKSKVALSADPSGALKFNTDQLNAKAGNVSVAFLNESSTPHNVTITGAGNKELGATKDITKGHAVLKVDDLKAGSYTFFCSVPGHEQAGMKGTLTVR